MSVFWTPHRPEQDYAAGRLWALGLFVMLAGLFAFGPRLLRARRAAAPVPPVPEPAASVPAAPEPATDETLEEDETPEENDDWDEPPADG